MRPLFPSAALAALLAMSAAHADVVIIQQGPVALAPALHVPAQGSAFAMAERFIQDAVVPRFPAPIRIGDAAPELPLLPPVLIPVEDDLPPVSDPIPFVGEWAVVAIHDSAHGPLDFGDDLLARVSFSIDADGRFGGSAGCNGYFGNMLLSDGVLSSDGMGMTMMLCPEDQMDLERAFSGAVGSAVFFAHGQDRLFFLDAEGNLLIGFEAR